MKPLYYWVKYVLGIQKVISKASFNQSSNSVSVVLDRKFDKTASTGGFELILKQPVITDPPPLDTGTNVLSINGKKIKKKQPKR